LCTSLFSVVNQHNETRAQAQADINTDFSALNDSEMKYYTSDVQASHEIVH